MKPIRQFYVIVNLNLNPVFQIRVTDAKVGLHEMKSKCPDKFITCHCNINLIRNNSNALSLTFKYNVDILMIAETKLEDLFLTAQFLLHGSSAPYRLDSY